MPNQNLIGVSKTLKSASNTVHPHVVKQILTDMHHHNVEYIERLHEVKSLHNIILNLVANDAMPSILDSLIHTNTSTVEQWIYDFEQWQNLLTDTKDHPDSIAGGMCDDYIFYQDNALHILNIVMVAIQQTEQLKQSFKQQINYEPVCSLLAVIKCLTNQLNTDLIAFSKRYKNVFAGV